MVCVLSRTWYKEIKSANGPTQNEPQTFAFRFLMLTPGLRTEVLLCFLIVGIHASGISVPLSLLMLLMGITFAELSVIL